MTYHVMRMTMGKPGDCETVKEEVAGLEKLTIIPGWVLGVCTVAGLSLIGALIVQQFI